MDKDRYCMLMKYPEFFHLTDDEEDLGWHYCREFQFLLIGPGMEEHGMCGCYGYFIEEDEDGHKDKGSRRGLHTDSSQ